MSPLGTLEAAQFGSGAILEAAQFGSGAILEAVQFILEARNDPSGPHCACANVVSILLT